MARKLQFKRGEKEDMPVLAEGEPAFTLDEKRMYIGTGKKNIGLASTEDLEKLKKVVDSVSGGNSFDEENYRLHTYTSLLQIGITVGEETIELIASNLPINSKLTCTIAAANADIYPNKYGVLTVTKTGIDRIAFELMQKQSTGKGSVNTAWYYGFGFFQDGEFYWTGWIESAKKSDLDNVSVESIGAAKRVDGRSFNNIDELRCCTTNGFVYDMPWNHSIVPNANNTIGIGGQDFLWAFDYRGKIFWKNNDGETWERYDDKFVPIDGSKALTDTLKMVSNGNFGSFEYNDHCNCYLECPNKEHSDGTKVARLLMAEYKDSSNNTPQAHKLVYQLKGYNGVEWTEYHVFTGFTKPFGSYVGNGSTASWEIKHVQTVSSLMCLIIGGSAIVLVSLAGGFVYKQNASGLVYISQEYVKYHQGTLTVATDNEYINKNGITYYYQFL